MSIKKVTFLDLSNSAGRLKAIRHKLSLSQSKLSEILEISISKVKSIESGRVKISPDLAKMLCEKFNLDFKWILTGEGRMYREDQTKTVRISESKIEIKENPPAEWQVTEKINADNATPKEIIVDETTEKILQLLEDMDASDKIEVLRSVEDKKLLKRLRQELKDKETG